MQLPNRVSVSDVRFEREASLTLTVIGIDAPGTAVDNILDHAEGPRAAFRCRETFGDALFESMKAAKLLVLVPPSKSSSIAASRRSKRVREASGALRRSGGDRTRF